MKRSLASLLFIAAMLLDQTCLAGSGGTVPAAPVIGVIAVTPVAEHTCVAMYVALDPAQALAGLSWYNNDGSVAFPRVLLAGGGDAPAVLAEATEASLNVVGASSDWSEIDFAEAVTSESGGLYVVFELPAFTEQTALGDGGGPGVGYCAAPSGLPGWLSADGQTWVRLHPDFRLAAVPVLVERSAGMKAMGTTSKAQSMPTAYSTALLAARPNPFNPRTELSFTLQSAGRAQIGIYNVRGELVYRVVDEDFAAGAHTVSWQGGNSHGQNCPSGVYFVRLQADGVVMTQRVTLVR